jgi:FKBP-type peptidyl-prolyl cis-trans isomerase FklB
MKKLLILTVCLCVAVAAQAQKKKKDNMAITQPVVLAAPANTWPKLANAQDSASYAYGIVLANSLNRQLNNDQLNRDLVIKGINAALRQDSLPFDLENAGKLYTTYNKTASAKAYEANRKAGETYLATNKTRSGVTTTASGLQYEVITPAADPNAAKPTATSRVTVHYVGTTVEGTEFDSSVRRGKPAEFGLNQVIPGWTEGLQLMRIGEKARFVIPQNLAYGERGNSGIKPYSTLIFEVELLGIK